MLWVFAIRLQEQQQQRAAVNKQTKLQVFLTIFDNFQQLLCKFRTLCGEDKEEGDQKLLLLPEQVLSCCKSLASSAVMDNWMPWYKDLQSHVVFANSLFHMITQENTANYWRSASSGRPCSPPSLSLHTHTQSPHTGAFLECVASLLSCPAEWGRRDWEPEASSSGNGKAAKAGKRGEQGRAGKGRGVLAAIDAEKFTFLAHCDCAWDTVKCLHCSACLQGGVSNTRREGNADWDLLRLVICILPSQKTSACGAGRMCLPTTHKHREGDRIYYIV